MLTAGKARLERFGHEDVRAEGPVLCPRCGARMGYEKPLLWDVLGQWHCVICGEIIDEVIAAHRRAAPHGTLDSSRAPSRRRRTR
ncbi:MAG: hypothetical protein HYY85_13200 [Deltaproteobacteria bacterium]|nr:hypothetical protein [Deltaproteobacteria bacterium]